MNLQRAMELAREAIEGRYEDTCTVTEYMDTTDPKTKRTIKKETDVIVDQPCRISFKTIAAANQTETGASITQTIKLFLAPELNIKPGSRITVTHQGLVTAYKCSGIPAIYSTHQEIMVILFEGWV